MGDAWVSLARPQEPSLPVWPGPAAVPWLVFCVCAPGARMVLAWSCRAGLGGSPRE